MAIEERETVRRTDPATGETHTHTTVVDHGEPRRGGGGNIALILVILAVAVVGILIAMQFLEAEQVQSDAISGAAESVGEAAGQVGDAAQEAADSVNPGN